VTTTLPERVSDDTTVGAAMPPVLLTMADYGGTLAAARCLGRAGIAVTVASDRAALPAAWSRWTTRRIRCPDVRDSERFLEWLVEFGTREPGFVLYPTCDDLVYLLARHRRDVETRFSVYQPTLSSILSLLDKARLAVAAQEAGLECPVTYIPADEADVARIAREARFPLVIKPRTQLMFRTRNKGIRVERATDLAGAYRAFVLTNTYLPPMAREHPEMLWPMLQEYHAEGETGIHSVAGFIDETGTLFAARASRKILQRPRRFGVGVCFETAPLEPREAQRLAALCKKAGYFGVFEAEFIPIGSRRLLIDFNPRYYNQMAFEIARGLPLPMLAYLGAFGDVRRLQDTVRQARAADGDGALVWCDRTVLALLLVAEVLAGRATLAGARKISMWYSEHRENLIDPIFDRDDRLPGALAVALEMRGAFRHPRGFIRSIAARP
jgi:D-aspartate ligase